MLSAGAGGEGTMEKSLYLATGGRGLAALQLQGSPARSGKQRRVCEGLQGSGAPQLPLSLGFVVPEFLLPLRRPKVCRRGKGTFPPCNPELLPGNLERSPGPCGEPGAPPTPPHSPIDARGPGCACSQDGGLNPGVCLRVCIFGFPENRANKP